MEEQDEKELQLLPTSLTIASPSPTLSHSSSLTYRSTTMMSDQFVGPSSSLDLQLSISLRPVHQHPSYRNDFDRVESLKQRTAEQIRLAAIEKAYAERVRELTKREMEMARSDFARAKHVWKRAREDVEKAEKMKERATLQTDSTCMGITCQSCRQRFKP
ncbi:hypothetical protein Godav_016638 [Gossypium davidsonii]|uniref:Uncharacterized protein n=2 Tax=Gossypium TaxID=3633 RepID=A0A7J8RSQ3_GOSDV|nr:hypothetical protein [Gossypium davidsonii]MBA0616600.1 hypothetical protein [Gossypium davidsonii]MBA0651872.1 hypothetical protein [Gossypium klotzschianum]